MHCCSQLGQMHAEKETGPEQVLTGKEKFDLGKEAQAALKNALKMIDSAKLGKEPTIVAVATDSEPAPKKWNRSENFCYRLFQIGITTAFVTVIFFGVLMAINFIFDEKNPTESIRASPLIDRLDDKMERLSKDMELNVRMNRVPNYDDIIKEKLAHMNERLNLVIDHLHTTKQSSKPEEGDMKASSIYVPRVPKAFPSYIRSPQSDIMATKELPMPHQMFGPMTHPFSKPMIHMSRRQMIPRPHSPVFRSPYEPILFPTSRKRRPYFSLSMTNEDKFEPQTRSPKTLGKPFVYRVEPFQPEVAFLTITVDEAIKILKDVRQKDTIREQLEYLSNTRIFHKLKALFRKGELNIEDYLHLMDDINIKPTAEALERLSEDPSEENLKRVIHTGERQLEHELELVEEQPGPFRGDAVYLRKKLRNFMRSLENDDTNEMGRLFNQFKVMMPVMSSMATKFFEVLQSDEISSDMNLINSDTVDLASELQKDGRQLLENLMHSPRGKKLMKKVCDLLGNLIELLEQARDDSPGLSLTVATNGNVEIQGADLIGADTIALVDDLIESIGEIQSEALALGKYAVLQTLQNPEVLSPIVSKMDRLANDVDHLAVNLDLKLTGKNSEMVGSGLQNLFQHMAGRNSPIAPLASVLFSMFQPQKENDAMKAMKATIEKDNRKYYEDAEDNGMFTDLASSIMGNIYGEKEKEIIAEDLALPTEGAAAEEVFEEVPEEIEAGSDHQGLIAFFNNGENASPLYIASEADKHKEAVEEAHSLEEKPEDSDIEFVYTVTTKPGESQLIDTSAKLSVID